MKVPDDSDDEDDSSSYDSSDDELFDFKEHDDHGHMELLQRIIEGAKKDAKFSIFRYAEKSYSRVKESLDRIYCDIRDKRGGTTKKVQAEERAVRQKMKCMIIWEFSFGHVRMQVAC